MYFIYWIELRIRTHFCLHAIRLVYKRGFAKKQTKKKNPQKPKDHMMNPLINHKQVIYKWNNSSKKSPLSSITSVKYSTVKVKALLLGETLECKFKSPALIKGEVDFKSSLWISSKNLEDTAKDRINNRFLFFGKEKEDREIPLARTLKHLSPSSTLRGHTEFQGKKKKPLPLLFPSRCQNYLILKILGLSGLIIFGNKQILDKI